MALVPCGECGKENAPETQRCLGCGAYTQTGWMVNIVVGAVWIALFYYFVLR